MVFPMDTSSRTPLGHNFLRFCMNGIQFPIDHFVDPFQSSVCDKTVCDNAVCGHVVARRRKKRRETRTLHNDLGFGMVCELPSFHPTLHAHACPGVMFPLLAAFASQLSLLPVGVLW